MHRLGTPLTAMTLALVLTSAASASEQVYQSVLPGTVWVKAVIGPGKASFGSGALVDAQRKWVVTNRHVVEDQGHVTVFFPVQKDGDVIADKIFYAVNEPKVGVAGRVIFRDATRDLAIIELGNLPAQAKAIKLAAKSAKPGQLLHVIGNPAGLALWVYSSGTVRSVFNKSWTAMTGEGKAMLLKAKVVETQIPINPGDSGGPVVNADSELVGIVSSYNKAQQLVSTCIDLSEVKNVIDKASKGDTGDIVVSNPQPIMPTPPTINPPPVINPFPQESTGPLPPRRE